MDSYEEFYRDYVDFMKKYSESGNALEMLGDYADYMSKLSDMTEKWDKLGEEEMTTEELKYYTDVQARVTKMLLDLAE